MPTTTQQSISPNHPTITTPQNKKTAFPQTTIQPTVKPSVAPKYSQAEITMNLEEKKNLKLHYVNNIHTSTSQLNSILDSDTELI